VENRPIGRRGERENEEEGEGAERERRRRGLTLLFFLWMKMDGRMDKFLHESWEKTSPRSVLINLLYTTFA